MISILLNMTVMVHFAVLTKKAAKALIVTIETLAARLAYKTAPCLTDSGPAKWFT